MADAIDVNAAPVLDMGTADTTTDKPAQPTTNKFTLATFKVEHTVNKKDIVLVAVIILAIAGAIKMLLMLINFLLTK